MEKRLSNSSPEAFVMTFAYLGGVLAHHRPLPNNAAATIRQLDPEAFDAGGTWRQLVEHLNAV